MLYYIIAGIVGAFILTMLLRRTGKNDHFKFNLKCPNCGFHKGILKCVNCEDKKRDNWR